MKNELLPNPLLRTTTPVLSAPIDALTWDHAIERIATWAGAKESRYVCICNAHSVVTADTDANFGNVVRNADMATPDGAPVAWMLRQMGHFGQERINGPDLMWKYCGYAEKAGESIYLYGSSPTTLKTLEQKLYVAFPDLTIAGSWSPPFRQLTSQEEDADIIRINASGASTVWVSLGCPKQELWMAAHRGRINAVMVGVGAAFDYHAELLGRAPLWMQRRGLEWLYRLACEPRRLWRRYLVTNTLFMVGAARQLIWR